MLTVVWMSLAAVAAPPEPPALPEGAFTMALQPGLVLSAYLPPDIPDAGYHRAAAEGLKWTDPRIFVLTADPGSTRCSASPACASPRGEATTMPDQARPNVAFRRA